METNAPSANNGSSSSVSSGSGIVFHPQQLQMLRNQIMAFKLLSSNSPIPPTLQEAIFGSSVVYSPVSNPVAARVIHGTAAGIKSASSSAAATPSGTSATAARTAVLDPHKLIIPTQMPVGMDPLRIVKLRDDIISARIKQRIEELECLPADLPPAVKVKALIELKSYSLLEKQRKIRDQVITGLQKSAKFESYLDRMGYTRIKKASLRETKFTEKMVRQHRSEKERKEKQSHVSYVAQVVKHGQEFIGFHRNYGSKVGKLGKALLQFHQNIEKEFSKRSDRLAKERIKALKADDEEAYLKLIDQQKDTRLTHLLKQTDAYLDNLTALVSQQQADIGTGAQQEIMEVEHEYNVDEIVDSGKKDYYSTAHKIKEIVTEQSSLLVGGKLKDYQLKGLQWLVSLYNNNLNGILADEMGLGKTIQTISLIAFLIEKKKQNGPYLIIVPLSTLTNWSLEFQKWAPDIIKVDYKGTPNVRKGIQVELKKSNFNVLLTTYEYIIKDRPFLARIKWLYMIIDEGHRMKNTQSKLSSVITQYYYTRYRVILTGTPLQNNLPELWALLNFVLPKIFNSSKSFDEWFNTPFANTGEKLELNEEETLLIIRRLHKVLRPFLLRRLKKDVEAELPDKVERILKCKMSGLQQSLYELLRKKNSAAHLASTGGMKKLNNTIMQLRKICNHPFVFEEVEKVVNPVRENNELLYRSAGKFELLRRMLPKFQASKHKVLMFFQMTQIMTIMEDFLAMLEIPYLRLDGATKSEDRTDLLKIFNNPDSPYMIFLLSTRAGGLGLNLQSADTVIIFDSDWNPHQDLQAQDRAHRIGQTKEVRIYRLVTIESVEEVILARAQYKLNLDGKIIQAGKFDQKSTNEEREAMLRALFERSRENEENDEIFDDDELNDIIARNDEELQLFKDLDKKRDSQDLVLWKSKYSAKAKVYPRLIETSELPSVYIEEEVEERAQAIAEAAAFIPDTRKSRKEVMYDDGLTEQQWVEAIDKGEDINERIERKRKRKKRTRKSDVSSNPAEDAEEEAEDDAENGVEEDSLKQSQAQTPGKKMRSSKQQRTPMRKSLKTLEKLDFDDSVYLDALEEEQILEIFTSCLDNLETLQDEDGRSRCEIFMDLPSQEDYPDYYEKIGRPISLGMIRESITNGSYDGSENKVSFKRDLLEMFENAFTYNVEGSFVWEDAFMMKQAFLEDYRQKLETAA